MPQPDRTNEQRSNPTSSARMQPGPGCGCGAGSQGSCQPSRREFLQWAGTSAAAMASLGASRAVGAEAADDQKPDHFVPAEKNLDPKWLEALRAKGGPTVYSGDDLERIGMPIGGLCTGQLYLGGDGRLLHWDIFNERIFSGYGATNYDSGRRPASPIRQGFAVRVVADGQTVVRSLDRAGFPGAQFCGEYPIGTVEYQDAGVPVAVTLEAFSPFIPLNAVDSALPATVLHFRVKNTSDKPADVTLAGWLENAVCVNSGREMPGQRGNRVVEQGGATVLLGEAKSEAQTQPERPPKVLADFEGENYGDWTVEGEAFGTGPAQGTLPDQQKVGGFEGKGLVNTFLRGDGTQGKLTSPKFTIDRRFISFLAGGGKQAGKTCINLLVDGQVVRTATGNDNEKLDVRNWNVADLEGKEAQIEIVDQATGAWGHVNVDQVELRDTPRSARSGPLTEQPDFGTMGLALVGPDGETLQALALPDGSLPDVLFAEDGGLAAAEKVEKPLAQRLCGALGRKVSLGPGAEADVTFAVTWHFPNRPENGNYYTKRFGNAADVAGYVSENFDRLSRETRLWHDTWYDSTLPRWLLDRLFSTVSILATGTCLWWANGRFWAWEGVGCCHGTCTHVWNYEHAMARLFPELERSCREMQDYGAGFVPESGMVRFRGEGWDMWAGDGQAGTVLKAYREHQISADDQFLRRLWPKIRKALEFSIEQDKKGQEAPDGVIEGMQHNTYDIEFYGANTMVGSLYLAALRAGEEMAREMGDADFAATCRRLFQSGSRLHVEQLFNGEYFVQNVDLTKHPKFQYADGCLSDQLFGQGWAHQVGLGCVYPKDKVDATLRSIWKYNWAPDVGPQNKAHAPERWFATPGEAGLLTCTWPRSKHLAEAVRYCDEVWTGIEYQVAGNMAWDGMVTEALAICRGVHERYHPAKRNPWNEIECGDHYSRAMASHGVFLGLCGFEYHGPKGHLGFAPRVTPEDFCAAFTGAEGWGTLTQQQKDGSQTNRIELKWGKLVVKTLALDLPEGATLASVAVTCAGQSVPVDLKQDGRRVLITLSEAATIQQGEAIEVKTSTSS